MEQNISWNGQDESLAGGSQIIQDDFQQFLDLGMGGLETDGSFTFDNFAPSSINGQQIGSGMEGIENSFGQELNMLEQRTNGQDPKSVAMAQIHNSISHSQPQQHTQQPGITTSIPHNQSIGQGDIGLIEIDAQIQFLQLQRQEQQKRMAQQQLQQQQQQQQQQNAFFAFSESQRVIPPTPNSMELAERDASNFMRQDANQQALYDAYQMHVQDQENAFTPLVSPAVTPLETSYNFGEYAVPDAYFSPLSSPALYAQNAGYRNAYGGQLDSSATTSPTDLSSHKTASAAAMARRRAVGNSMKPPSKQKSSRVVRQSPIVKPQRRRMTSTNLSAETLSELVDPLLPLETPKGGQPTGQPLASRSSSSEHDSISPVHLSDMAPPPLPKTHMAKVSPSSPPQSGNQSSGQQVVKTTANKLAPATPASLMRMSKNAETSTAPSLTTVVEQHDDNMLDFALPEAADGDFQAADASLRSAHATLVPPPPELAPAPSTQSQFAPTPSPQLKSSRSSFSNSSRKTPKLAARGSGQKAATSSVQASPAILPRISPNINPMVGRLDDTAALLLATKSNYQNILEGNHLPGVSYPPELSTSLTSKRTSHKIAEQGRRNRINMALQEMAALLPDTRTGKKRAVDDDDDGEDDDGKGQKGGPTSSSKASTVEHAIQYIKQLQLEVQQARKRAEEAESKLRAKEGGEQAKEVV